MLRTRDDNKDKHSSREFTVYNGRIISTYHTLKQVYVELQISDMKAYF